MDHYKVLGISRTATKEQIKQAFRKLALQFHPDKHSLSPKPVREDATRRFKQAFEAYDVLIDDQKRDFYNHSSNINNSRNSYQNYGYRKRSSSTNEGYAGSYSRENYSRGSNVSRFEVVFRYMGTRSFLINLVFAGLCLYLHHWYCHYKNDNCNDKSDKYGFKQATESYDVLIDNQKRQFYNHSSNSNNSRNSYQNYGYRGKSSSNNNGFSSNGYGGSTYGRDSSVSRFEVVFRYLGTHSFLINLVFVGGLLGGSYFISSSGDALWKMRNSGKSFEEVMETREKTKEVKYEKV